MAKVPKMNDLLQSFLFLTILVLTAEVPIKAIIFVFLGEIVILYYAPVSGSECTPLNITIFLNCKIEKV